MKLMIKNKYFTQIKSGRKTIDFRDAHITFINEETKETLIKNVVNSRVIKRPITFDLYGDILREENIIVFELK